jgi:double-strand break repair protein MRE11
LISSDNHLGYKEKDEIIGEDSFDAFNEVLELAVSMNVDFLLLGGDLFHEHSPSQNAYYKCSKIFNKHVFGNALAP